MKKILLLAVLCMGVMFGASAQELIKFQSTENGIQILFPGEATIDTDNGEELILEGEDYIFTALYFNPSETEDDDLTNAYAKLLTASNVDIDKGKQQEFASKTLTGSMFIAASDDILGISGIVYSKENPEEVGFIFMMASTHEHLNMAVKAVKSFEFYLDKIK